MKKYFFDQKNRSRKNIFSIKLFFDLKKNQTHFRDFEIWDFWNFGPLFENFEIFEISNQDKKNSTHSNLSRFFLWPRMVMKFQKSIGFPFANFLQVFQKKSELVRIPALGVIYIYIFIHVTHPRRVPLQSFKMRLRRD